MRFAVPVAAVLAALCVLDAPAVAARPRTPRALSVGYPNGGKLVGGQLLRASRYMKVIPTHEERTTHYALPQLLALLDRASRKVADRYPGSVLGVGELSPRGGGPSRLHHSHQNGRDADVAFYLIKGNGKRVRRQTHLIRIDAEGRSRENPTTRFDDARNWTFVSALLTDRRAEVVQIFISSPLRARLLAYAKKVKAPAAVQARAAAIMIQPANAESHDDHFHVRIACPKGMDGCMTYARARAKPVHKEQAVEVADAKGGSVAADEEETEIAEEGSVAKGGAALEEDAEEAEKGAAGRDKKKSGATKQGERSGEGGGAVGRDEGSGAPKQDEQGAETRGAGREDKGSGAPKQDERGAETRGAGREDKGSGATKEKEGRAPERGGAGNGP